MNELKIYKLNCASCNSNLEVPSDIDKFNCSYCGTQQIVQRSGGIIALREVIDAVNKVQTGTDKTAAELALVRLQKEQNDLDYKLGERERFWNHYINEQIKPFETKLENNSTEAYGLGCVTFFGSFILIFLPIFAILQWLGIDIKKGTDKSQDFFDSVIQVIVLGVPFLISGYLTFISYRYIAKQENPIRVEREELLKRLTNEKQTELKSISNKIRENPKAIEINRSIVKHQD